MAARDRYNPQRFRIPFSAEVAKSVDAVDSKSTVEIRAGSSPAFGTIGTSIDVNGRLFLCLKSSIRKAFLAFSLNLSQPDSIYINLLMRVQLRVYPGSIMFVPTEGSGGKLTTFSQASDEIDNDEDVASVMVEIGIVFLQ